MGGNCVKKNIGEKDGRKSMGEKFVKSMGENVVKRMGENFVKSMGENVVKRMGENFVKSMGENVVKRMGEKRGVKKVWVKIL